MDIKLDVDIIRKLSARGILNYVAMSMCSKANKATQAELAKASGIDAEALALKRQRDVDVLQNLDFSKKARKKREVKPFVLPDWIPQQVWDGFIDGRRRKRAATTDYAYHLIVKELVKLKAEGHDPVDVLNQSVRRGWIDVFPIKTESYMPPPATRALQPTEFKV